MPEYLHPGVYIEETSYRSKPIEGVSTSTAGFVGRALRGPAGRPVLVTSFNDFRRTFGEPVAEPTGRGDYLGHAVKNFFDNGGSRAWVVRALPSNAARSSRGIRRGVAVRFKQGLTVRGPTATFPLRSLRSIAVGDSLVLHVRDNATAPFQNRGTYTVTDYNATRNEVTVNPPLGTGVAIPAANAWLEISGRLPAAGGPTFEARDPGASGDGLSINIVPADRPPVRLAAVSASRSRPVVATVSIGAGLNSMRIPAAELARVRQGDILRIGDSVLVTVQTVAAASVELDPTGDVTVDYSAGTAELTERGGTALPTALSLPPPDLSASGLVAGTRDTIDLPHDFAATLQPNDEVTLTSGTDTATLAIVTVNLSDAAGNVTFQPALTTAVTNQPVRVEEAVDMGAPAPLRVLLGSIPTELDAPFRAAGAQSVALANGDGSALDAASVLLVQPATGTVFLQRTAGEFPTNVGTDTWERLELLELALATTSTLRVASTGSFYQGAIVELDTGTTKIPRVIDAVDHATRSVTLTSPVGTSVTVPANPDDRRVYLRTAEIDIEILRDGAAVETFSGLTWNSDAALESFSRYFMTRLNDPEVGSSVVRITAPGTLGTGVVDQPTTANGLPASLQGGSDGGALSNLDIIGQDNGPGQRTGIEALRERTDIAIVAVPGVHDEAVQQALITHCENLKYRFAILDGEIGVADVGRIEAHRNNYDSKYAAYYAPWLRALNLTTGGTITLPPSGFVAGIYARSDTERGVHKAPANEVVRNITDVDMRFSDGEQDVLNPVGVNLIRDLTPRGIRVWGARTISSDPEWKYINVRRLFIYLEHSIDRGTQWVVFEPNNESLWDRVRGTIESFLDGVWRSGALMGTKPEEAFFVKCDRTTMTQDDLDNGRLIVQIGVAPVYPAEFVIFRIGQFTASSN